MKKKYVKPTIQSFHEEDLENLIANASSCYAYY